MLLIVFLLVDNNVSVDEDIVEEEKLPGFGLFTTSFGKDSFTNQNSSGNVEGCTCTSKAAFDQGNSSGVGLTIYCKCTKIENY
jgi:hypothetical protein